MPNRSSLCSVMVIAMIALGSPAAIAAPQETKANSALSETLYKGMLASGLLDSRVFSRAGEHLGHVRNIVFADDGSVKAIIAEQAGFGTKLEFMFRVPWSAISQPARPGALIADLSDARSPQFGLFGEEAEKKGGEFLATEVLGDYVRLQTGLGYGYVKDLVLAPKGQMIAVLVARDTPAGGGTAAFPYPGRTGRWSADMSYYGLPFVTAEQANAAAIKVNLRQFESME
jgi:sporulation protein YlmC with PRC-barrel domain